MQSFVAMLGIAAVLFAWTNVDDLFVLIGFFSDARVRARFVVVGQYIGIGMLYAVSVLVSLLAIVIRPAYVGLLGLLPILIGVGKLRSRWRDAAPDTEGRNKQAAISERAGRSILTVALTTVANGGDNVSVYAPLFATRSAPEVAAAGFVFAVMTALWCVLGHWLVNHPTAGIPIRRYAHRTLPFLLIGVGIFIMFAADTFSLI